MIVLRYLVLFLSITVHYSAAVRDRYITHSNYQLAFQNVRSPKKIAVATRVRTYQPLSFKRSSFRNENKRNVLELQEQKSTNEEHVQLDTSESFYVQEIESSPSKSSSTGTLLSIASASIITVSLMAYTGVLTGLDGGSDLYTLPLILRDISATLFAIIAAGMFVKAITSASKNGLINSRDSRKILHSLSGPLFIFCWPLYSSLRSARFFAAIVPLLFGVRLFIAGSGYKKFGDESELADAVSRSGDYKEALQGPFVYSIILFLGVLAFWDFNLNGIVGISVMAAGDGAADIIGRRLGKSNKWFFNANKSIAGTIAFFIASYITTAGLVFWLTFNGCVSLPILDISSFVTRLGVICGLTSFVELIPLGDDNWNVPISAIILSAFLLQ